MSRKELRNRMGWALAGALAALCVMLLLGGAKAGEGGVGRYELHMRHGTTQEACVFDTVTGETKLVFRANNWQLGKPFEAMTNFPQ